MEKSRFPLIIFSLIAISAIYLITIITAYPLIGLRVTPLNNEICEVTEVYPYGWASYQNIKKKDRIYYQSDSDSTFKLDKQDQIILYPNEGGIRQIHVDYKGMPFGFYFYSFLPVLYFIVCYAIALYLYTKKGLNKISMNSSYLLLFIGLACLGSVVSTRGDMFGIFVTIFSLYLIPAMLLAYLQIMLSKRDSHPADNKKILLYGILLITAIILAIIGIPKFMLVPFLFMLLAVSYYFIIRFSTIKKSIHYVKVRFFIWTIIFSLCPFIFLSAVPEVLFEQQMVDAEYTALFMLFIPFSFVYANMKKVFFDFEFFIKRFLINFSISLIAGLMLAGVVYIKEGFSIFGFRVLLVSIILIMLLFYLKDILYTHLVREQRKFPDSLMKLSQRSGQLRDEQTLFSYVNQVISDVLHVDNVKMVRYKAKNDQDVEGQVHASFIIHATDIGDLQETDNGYALLTGKSSLDYTFITFSYKKEMIQLNKEEKEWLKSIAHYINLLMENFKKTEDLLVEIEKFSKESTSTTLSRTLLLIGERERVKLAHNIHDSILQELIFISKNIELMQTMKDQPYDSLEKVKAQISEQIDFIRNTCYDLNPFFIKEFGLADSLTILIDRYRRTCNFEIDFQITHAHHFIGLSEEYSLMLHRIIQELMSNAKKHSQANFIYLSLSYRNSSFILIYEDDGIGFELGQEKSGKHFGLMGVQERIRSLNGEVFIHTEPKQGLLLKAVIPE